MYYNESVTTLILKQTLLTYTLVMSINLGYVFRQMGLKTDSVALWRHLLTLLPSVQKKPGFATTGRARACSNWLTVAGGNVLITQIEFRERPWGVSVITVLPERSRATCRNTQT